MNCGIDIGTKDIGYALIHDKIIVASGVWHFQGRLLERLEELCYESARFFGAQWFDSIEIVGIEDVWVGPNRQTSIKLAKAWGIVYAAAVVNVMNVFEIAPSAAKKALTGNGRANKADVLRYVNEHIQPCSSQDEADAIAVAYAI